MVDRVGQQLGNYRLIQLLGRGGFAEVYLGEHIYLNTLAAIKVHNTTLTSDEIGLFRNEARTIAHLIHPHIVRLLDFGVEGNTPFMVMDYAPNGTLRDRHPVGLQIPLATILSYVKQIANALQYAHDQKLIHRDIKPGNMLVGRHNEVLLSDFGIAVIAHSARSLRMEDVAGTPTYMAPEQFEGKPSKASDQYALGIIVYEWLCGETPFHGNLHELRSQHLFVPPPLNEEIFTLSPGIKYVILKALAKDPRHRFASVEEFAFELERTCQPAASTIRIPLSNTSPSLPVSFSERRQPAAFVSPGSLVFRYSGHFDRITDMAWSPDGKYIVTTSADKTTQVWNATTGDNIFKCNVQQSSSVDVIFSSVWPKAVAWSPDGTQIAIVHSNGTIEVWDVMSNNKVCAYDNRKNNSGIVENIRALAWSPTGKNIAFTCSNPSTKKETVKVWRVATTRKFFPYKGHFSPVNSFVWSPDGERIASASRNAQVWSVTKGGRTFIFHNKFSEANVTAWLSNKVNAVTWSPNGKYIAFASDDKTVEVWDADTGGYIFTYRGHFRWWGGQVKAMAWSPDGQYIASGGTDKTIQVWSISTGTLISTYQGHLNTIAAIAWSPSDGTRIASRSKDKTVQVWQVV
jgi:serine/threonine protein kinase